MSYSIYQGVPISQIQFNIVRADSGRYRQK